jgi:hydrogenase maturation protein HypF
MSSETTVGMELRRLHILAGGQVQGVGFRPFVYRLAAELNLTGWVVNDAGGVTIEVQGLPADVEQFPRRLLAELPPLARMARCDVAEMETVAGEKTFEIRPSADGELADAQITVDTAVCDDCLREMRDPDDPRYRYPFINCTNCGPRYTIVNRIPYDRPNTTMADFAMCPLCEAEYADPSNRRFHAQPIACPACGPGVWLADSAGLTIECDDPVAAAAEMLEAGRIVAIKGLGGFHLACRADRQQVVLRLRRRKRRDEKPFAIMVRDLSAAEALCELTDEARRLLAGHLRPIVLLPRLAGARDAIAPAVADNLPCLGIMLPYTPLHHLLFDHVARPLVMTSANYADEPLVKDNDAAFAELAGLADALLLHNRRIQRRLDDSVVQLTGLGTLSVIRRARGYAPQPTRLRIPQLRIADCGLRIEDGGNSREFRELLSGGAPSGNPQGQVKSGEKSRPRVNGRDAHLPTSLSQCDPKQSGDTSADIVPAEGKSAIRNPQSAIEESAIRNGFNPQSAIRNLSILAVGAELKSAVCLYRAGWAMLGEHIGDLKDGRTCRHFIDTIRHLEDLFEVRPEVIACDMHPQYLSSDYAARRARGELAGCPPGRLIRVQHHHAHAAACLAENDHAGQALAIVADGTGYGDDGAVWGCEVFRCDLAGYQRLAHLRYTRLPGGDKAAEETFRPALAGLYEAIGEDCLRHPIIKRLGADRDTIRQTLDQLLAGVNCPQSSSLGRWFDAAAALAGVARANRFEGQAPMMLEAAIDPGVEDAYPFAIDAQTTPMLIDLRPTVLALADDAASATSPAALAAKFHNTVAAFLHAAASLARDRTALSTLALSGGCFMNRRLLARLVRLLQADGFTVLTHRTVPTNDACIALGQAVSAAAIIASEAGAPL